MGQTSKIIIGILALISCAFLINYAGGIDLGFLIGVVIAVSAIIIYKNYQKNLNK